MTDNDDETRRRVYDNRIRSASTLCQILWRQGVFSIGPAIDQPGKKDPIVSILDKLALCLIRTMPETVAVSLVDDRLNAVSDDLSAQVAPVRS